jgi:hypothetical protein
MEALRRVAALELTLHREDGTRVETESVSIWDTEMLLALTKDLDETFDEDDWRSYEELVDEDDPFDLNLEPQAMFSSPTFREIEPWQPEDDSSGGENGEFPRFQIYVEVVAPLDDARVIDDDWWRRHDRDW